MAVRPCPRRLWLRFAVIFSFFSAAASAQQKLLTLDDIYGPTTRVNFSGAPAPAFAWLDGTHYAWPRPTGEVRGVVEWMKVDAATGSTAPLFDAAKAEAALATLPGVAAADAKQLVRSRDLIFNRSHSAAILTIADDLYLYTIADSRAVRLTSTSGEEEEATFSPDGSKIAFVRDNNLFVVDAATRHETALTADGTARILNGKLDWVYEEEIYGRGQKRAYWWSPDSTRLAFLRIDDTRVSTYVTLDDIPYDPKVETWQYPRAGDPNPTATLGVARATGGSPDWIDMSRYAGADHLIVRVAWTPDARRLAYEVQNRTQSWLELNTVDVAAGLENTTRTIVHETSPFWINSEDTTTPTWLRDGSFLWLSAQSGFTHAYHYKADGTLIKQVTTGAWELRTLHGVDEKAGWVYFSGTERSPIGNDVYRIKLDGSGLERLSKAAGTHDADFSPEFAYYIDRWSDVATPVQARLYRNNGQDVRVLHENTVSAFAQYKLSAPEFVQVKTRDGFVMEAMMIKPPDFDASRRYPVYQFTYGGPHTQQVKNAWGGSQYMYHQLLAQHGVIVWICDNRTASGKGVESTWPVFKHFGDGELRDIEDGLSWLKQQPYVNGSRIGIHGWSFGGFMTAYALTHSTSFAMGIAGGTVADWRDYDSVYTERYMGTPQENPDGYRKSSPRFAAADLHGSLLLVHGAIDDNVHPQNSMQLAYELQKAGKPFNLMLYPKSRHGITDPALARHLRAAMLAFTLEHLKPSESAGSR